MKEITFEQWKRMLESAGETIIENEQYLCKLDSYVGDGDHGLTAARGFAAAQDALKLTYTSLCEVTEGVAKALSKGMGGAIGPIFGSVFTAMAKSMAGKMVLTIGDVADMFQSALKNVKLIGGAKEGDRTLVDALSPVADAFVAAASQNMNVGEAFVMATEQAKNGCEATKEMVAKKGRAKFLGEKSKGYQDAGATTFYLIIKAMSDYIVQEGS